MKLFGGFEVIGGSSEIEQILLKRSNFITQYCEFKGWTAPLSMEQVIEIRAQEGWKHPQ